MHAEFIRIVADYRNMSIAAVEAVADGATMPGARALEVGLIDYVGGREQAREVLASITGTSVEDVRFCEYTSSLFPF